MTDLAKLIERVEAAHGPDAELDEALTAFVVGAERVDDATFDHKHGYTRDGSWVSIGPIQPITASHDAALALKEALLPGWYWRAGWGSVGEWVNGRRMQGWCHLNRVHPDHCNREDEATGRAATPPLAIVLATLKALQERQK